MIRWYYAVACHPDRCFKFTGTSKSGAARYNQFPRSGTAQPRGDLFKFYEILKSPSLSSTFFPSHDLDDSDSEMPDLFQKYHDSDDSLPELSDLQDCFDF